MGEKVALVTGASKGIGRACAESLAAAGYRIAVHYRSSAPEAEETLRLCGGSGAIFHSDLAQSAAASQLVDAVRSQLGRIDCLVCNAGVSVDSLLPFAKEDSFDALIAINLKPAFMLAKLTSKQMIKQKSGCIINISSVVGHSGNVGQSVYSATKAALTGFTKSVALDLARYGIRANCVAPGYIETAMTARFAGEAKEQIRARIPLGRFGTPADVGAAVAYLASDAASYVTGSTLHVNGGLYLS